MDSYRINEIYYTVQGEGMHTGRQIVLVRFSDCNLACPFCDTEFKTGKQMGLGEIEKAISECGPKCESLLLTGGEPLLQLDEAFVSFFRSRGFWVAVETNGTVAPKFKSQVDWLTCSPKAKRTKLGRMPIDELRVPVPYGNYAVSELLKIEAANYYVSPIFDGNKLNPHHVDHALRLMRLYPALKLSVQTHKLLGVK